jgi:hypothetical protein
MPGRTRLSLPGIPWHIMQQDNNRSACFYTGEDYLYCLNKKGRRDLSATARLCLLSRSTAYFHVSVLRCSTTYVHVGKFLTNSTVRFKISSFLITNKCCNGHQQ